MWGLAFFSVALNLVLLSCEPRTTWRPVEAIDNARAS